MNPVTTPDHDLLSPANMERLRQLVDRFRPAFRRLERELLGFVAEMYGVQLDQLAALLTDRGEPADRAASQAREVVASWRAARCADTAQLSDGEPWVWATRSGLSECDLNVRAVRPKVSDLRHTHAVTDVRLALERESAYREGCATWRAERSIIGRPQYTTRTEHLPDGEVHWPADSGSAYAGETWAMEVEITRKSVPRIAAIMREVLARTSDYGCPPETIAVPGLPPRYARLVYLCSPKSIGAVLKARAEVGPPQSARIEVYDLPESAMLLETPKRGELP